MIYSPSYRPYYPLGLDEEIPLLVLGGLADSETLASAFALLAPRSRTMVTIVKEPQVSIAFCHFTQLKIWTRVLWRLMRQYELSGHPRVLGSLCEVYCEYRDTLTTWRVDARIHVDPSLSDGLTGELRLRASYATPHRGHLQLHLSEDITWRTWEATLGPSQLRELSGP
ncbi:hypothetical protein T492DRAFT_910976 [Pavlovales sp. CCMP2436]|nr:hypothetical protein T492DRAFT_910976 [Pavlovales sp. CCMP2436]